jgi:hypothetical protein
MRLSYRLSPTGFWQVHAHYRRCEAISVREDRAEASLIAMRRVLHAAQEYTLLYGGRF